MEESWHARVVRRPAEETDVPFLMQLRHQTMDQHLSASGVEISEVEHLRRVRFRFECAEIILVDGEASGLVKVARDGKRWHLIQVQLIPRLQGLGLGSRMLEDVVNEARIAGASVELDVLKANPARRLYERLGFVVVGESADSFDMKLETAVDL